MNSTNSESLRHQMVAQQIRTWDVFDEETLEAVDGVPRDRFLPAGLASVAYADTEIPLAHGRCLLRPNIVGRMLQALDLDRRDTVLEVGTGVGYVAACIARLAARVVSVDIYQDFVDSAAANLESVGIDNAELQCLPSFAQLPDGPFDAIAVTGSVASVDPALPDALADGGRLFVVVGDPPVMQATLITRAADGAVTSRIVFETDIPRLVPSAPHPEFRF